jgi:hypothetical protein
MLIDMNALAMLGARARLEQLQAEAEEIRRVFPDLRTTASRNGRASAAAETSDGARPGRKPMSAAEKRAVSARMTKYWAGRRQARAAGAGDSASPSSSAPKKRTISPEGRARIAEAQKRRWAAARKTKSAAEPTAAASGEAAAAAQRTGRKRSAGKRAAVKRQPAAAAR